MWSFPIAKMKKPLFLRVMGFLEAKSGMSRRSLSSVQRIIDSLPLKSSTIAVQDSTQSPSLR